MAERDERGMQPVRDPLEIGGIWCHYKGDRIELELFPLAVVSSEESADEDPPSGHEPSRVWMPRENFYDTVQRLTTVANALRRIYKD